MSIFSKNATLWTELTWYVSAKLHKRHSRRALQSRRQIRYLLKNRNFGCLIGPPYCMGAAVSVFFSKNAAVWTELTCYVSAK